MLEHEYFDEDILRCDPVLCRLSAHISRREGTGKRVVDSADYCGDSDCGNNPHSHTKKFGKVVKHRKSGNGRREK